MTLAIAQCVRGATARLAGWLFDLRHRCETVRHVELATLAVVGPNRDRGIRYQPTPAGPLRRVLLSLEIPPGEVFVDLGCGKGRVLLVAGELPFRRLVGVEFSAELCLAARRHLAGRSADSTPALIHHRDAADHPFDEGETVIYLFNPFDAVVLARVMERLAESLRRVPRRAWLVYLFPRWREVIDATGMFSLDRLVVDGGSEFAVYIHEPQAGVAPCHSASLERHPVGARPLDQRDPAPGVEGSAP